MGGDIAMAIVLVAALQIATAYTGQAMLAIIFELYVEIALSHPVDIIDQRIAERPAARITGIFTGQPIPAIVGVGGVAVVDGVVDTIDIGAPVVAGGLVNLGLASTILPNPELYFSPFPRAEPLPCENMRLISIGSFPFPGKYRSV